MPDCASISGLTHHGVSDMWDASWVWMIRIARDCAGAACSCKRQGGGAGNKLTAALPRETPPQRFQIPCRQRHRCFVFDGVDVVACGIVLLARCALRCTLLPLTASMAGPGPGPGLAPACPLVSYLILTHAYPWFVVSIPWSSTSPRSISVGRSETLGHACMLALHRLLQSPHWTPQLFVLVVPNLLSAAPRH